MGIRGATRRGAAGLVAVLVVVGLAGCATDAGEAAARRAVQEVAEEIGEQLTPPVIRVREADWLVVNEVASHDDAERGVRVEPLSWSGTTGPADDGAGARITVRITVQLPAKTSSTLFGESYAASSATRCYRYGVIGFRFFDTLQFEEIACTSEAAPALPTPETIPALSEDAEAVLGAVLRDATAEDVDAAVADAFPQPEVTTQTEVVGGELVASVGIPVERDCLVMVRRVTGVVERLAFDSEWLEPGELGCSTRLYTAPPR